MKKRMASLCASFTAVFLALLLCGLAVPSVLAEEATIPTPDSEEEATTVYLTVADGNGALALVQEEILLRDADGDGALTIQDVLLCAHETRFEGGAEAGYASGSTGDGLFVTKLWGVETGDCKCYINHIAASDLLSPVRQGDQICAAVSAGSEEEKALYCYFDASRASVAGEETLVLTLNALTSDAEGGPTAQPVAGAIIQIDGRDTAFFTNEEGKVTLRFDGSGACIVSARKNDVLLIPPVCTVEVSAEEPAAGDRGLLLWVGLSAAAAICLICTIRRRVRRADSL